MNKKVILKSRIFWSRESPKKTGLPDTPGRVEFIDKEKISVCSTREMRELGKYISPEELLVSALSLSQMDTYLSLAARHKIEVVQYEDFPEIFQSANSNGQMEVKRILLKPRITFLGAENMSVRAMAIRLIHEAHDECLSGRISKIEVEVEPIFIWSVV